MAKRGGVQAKTMQIAFCGMMAALSVVLLVLGAYIPILLYFAPLMAGVLLLPVQLECSTKAAWLTWIAAALCILFLGADKEAALFYLLVGYYPIIKWRLEQKVPKRWHLFAKLAYFLFISLIMEGLLLLLFPAQSMSAEFGQAWLMMEALLVVMMIVSLWLYDRLLNGLMVMYIRKLQPLLKFLHR